MSFVISYYNDAENPIDNDTVLMDTWDELEEEEQRKYLKSLFKRRNYYV